ncbi:ACP S-malonyltransferase [Labrenzia sp. PHM005]|uniref:ACP S-malonyltransferase n=1 Tax=Labrenzia sp. PHM005 TaxID=2590016 RepID=UPI0011403D61|nr:ACP S-malonyltransferase [Labrenzia sp. PHM005]QDG75030.1 ACP S-malonyltransferase [Labrenzia sp. PHM005]
MKAFLFPGQGSQHIGMGEGLFERYSEMTEAADTVLGYSIADLCLRDPDKQLTQTEFTQPALFVVNAMMARAQQDDSGAPDIAAGHSVGEYNALHQAGVVNFEDGLRLVQKRGALMSTAPKGGMAAVIGLTPDRIATVLQDNGFASIDVANLNSDKQTIISGLIEDISAVEPFFSDAGAMYIPLNVSGAFHSRYMAPVQEEFEAFLGEFRFEAPGIPVIANVDARPYQDGCTAQMLAQQLTSPVRWQESIGYMLNLGVGHFFETGPGNVLSKLVAGIRKQHVVTPVETELPPQAGSPPVLQEETQAQEAKTPVQIVEDWNTQHSAGIDVQVNGYDGVMKTRSEAILLFGHRPAVYMEGYSGYFALSDVTPIEAQLS